MALTKLAFSWQNLKPFEVTATLNTDNEMSDYRVTRSASSVQARLYDENELGLVFGDQYKLAESRTGDYYCTDSNCNSLNLQTPPIRSVNRNDLECLVCSTKDKTTVY